MSEERWEVPSSWTWTQLGGVADVVGGGTPPSSDPSNFDEKGVAWLTPADLSGYAEKRISRGARSLSAKGLENCGARVLPAGSVLLSSRAPIGYVVVAANPVATNQGFKSFVLPSGLLSDFVLYFLRFAKNLLLTLASGTTFLELSGAKAKLIPLPLAPEAEQQRIVAAIEEQLSRVDAGVEALERVKKELARYRASVLKAACEGRLVPTEAALARAEGRSYEPASELLARILAERRARWDRKKKYAEPAPPDTSSRSALPEGWVWATLAMLAELKGGITKGQKRQSGEKLREVPYLRVANVQRGWLDLTKIKTIEAAEDEIADLRLCAGDVLFNEGGDRDKLGRGWVWQGQIPECIHQNHVFRARLIGGVSPKFLSWHGNSFGQSWFEEHGKQTTNLASINLTRLGLLPVPLPPLAEQQRIVAEVERRLSIADEVAASVGFALARAARLRQSILKRAFEGKLVPQDPNDEPASVLLARIRAGRERAASAAPKRRARRRV